MKSGLAKANFERHKKVCIVKSGGVKMTIFDTFNASTTFATIPIGGEFVEALTTCNEVATRIEPTTHQGKPVNARRLGGKLVFMVEWEPVFARGNDG
jgi:hypothetical protein